MKAEPGRHWLKDAKCQDPFRTGCNWSGDIWIELKPIELCMGCPECTGHSFTVMVMVARTQWTRRLTGFTP